METWEMDTKKYTWKKKGKQTEQSQSTNWQKKQARRQQHVFAVHRYPVIKWYQSSSEISHSDPNHHTSHITQATGTPQCSATAGIKRRPGPRNKWTSQNLTNMAIWTNHNKVIIRWFQCDLKKKRCQHVRETSRNNFSGCTWGPRESPRDEFHSSEKITRAIISPIATTMCSKRPSMDYILNWIKTW